MPDRVDPIPALKRQLALELGRALERWDTPELSYKLHTGVANVSRLRRGRVDRFSVESLIVFLARMNYVVALSVEPEPERERRAGAQRSRPSRVDMRHVTRYG